MPSTAPDFQPEFFIDRSLGAHKLRLALERAGYTVHTMNQRYGVAEAEALEDPVWIRDAGAQGFLILTKDDVRSPEPQLRAIEQAHAKIFFLTNRHLRGDEIVGWFLRHLDGIIHRGRQPGPFMYGVFSNRLERMRLRQPPAPLAPEQGTLETPSGP